jgi:hypothetical protein
VSTIEGARIAAAPISWGVCEVPGWGRQTAPERVLEGSLIAVEYLRGILA